MSVYRSIYLSACLFICVLRLSLVSPFVSRRPASRVRACTHRPLSLFLQIELYRPERVRVQLRHQRRTLQQARLDRHRPKVFLQVLTAE